MNSLEWGKWSFMGKKYVKNKQFKKAIDAFQKANKLAGIVGKEKFEIEKLFQANSTFTKLQSKKFLFLVQKEILNNNWKRASNYLKKIDTSPIKNQLKKIVEKEYFPKHMVFIPSFPFVMGSMDEIDEMPPYLANPPAYFIDKYEVSNKDYYEFIQATGNKAPIHWENNIPSEKIQNLPVVNVSWYDANNYAKWRKKRLPSEVEWEKAAKTNYPQSLEMLSKMKSFSPKEKMKKEELVKFLGRKYPWGNYWDRERVPKQASNVQFYSSGRSYFQCYNMAGNVWEWTDSWYKPYHKSVQSKYFGEKFKVIRGGSYLSNKKDTRTSNRSTYQPRVFFDDLGFRCAKSVK